MSGYFELLDWQGKKRYKEKLETVGLSLEDDLYCSLPIQRLEVTTHFPLSAVVHATTLFANQIGAI